MPTQTRDRSIRLRRAAEAIARRVTDAIGDGCVVRMLDAAARQLTAVAADHRDPTRRTALGVLLTDEGPAVVQGWNGHVMRCGRPVRLAAVAGRCLRDAGGGADRPEGMLASMLLAPLRFDGEIVGVVAALRDQGGISYSLREQAQMERIVADESRGCESSHDPQAGCEPLDGPSLAAQLLQRSDAAVWATDRDGRTLALTPAMSELLALPVGEVGGLPMADFVAPLPLMLCGVVPDEPERGDRRLHRADGGTLWVATCSTPLVGVDGRRHGTITTMTDVTERKQQELSVRIRLDAATNLSRVLSGVLRGDDRAELLDCVAGAIADVLGVSRAGVFELRRDGSLLLCAGRGWSAGMIGRHRAATLGSPVAIALTGAEAVAVSDLSTLPGGAVGGGARSGCWVGVGGGRGVLAALHDEPRDFDRVEREFLMSLAEAVDGCVGVAVPAREGPASRMEETART